MQNDINLMSAFSIPNQTFILTSTRDNECHKIQ
jgi:hypothetical protein